MRIKSSISISPTARGVYRTKMLNLHDRPGEMIRATNACAGKTLRIRLPLSRLRGQDALAPRRNMNTYPTPQVCPSGAPQV